MIDVEEIEPRISSEPWCEYNMENSETLMVRLVLVRALRALTEKSPTGEPVYVVNTQVIVKTREKK